jgi:hypothetical protein
LFEFKVGVEFITAVGLGATPLPEDEFELTLAGFTTELLGTGGLCKIPPSVDFKPALAGVLVEGILLGVVELVPVRGDAVG